ncbi:MAG: thiopurine S-methyltransferase [Gammaproteobacteria bacterium]
MDADFWLERWRRGETGFHLPTVNPHLVRHWPGLGLAPGARVLVPLAGKSVDLAWLREQGCEVVAIELSPLAAEACFAALGVEPRRRRLGAFDEWAMPGLRFLIGDFFAATREQVGPIDAFYDRAALVALPPAARAAYVVQLLELARDTARGLLVGFEYPQGELAGPPFAVEEPEVRALFEPQCDVRVLEHLDILDAEPRFKARGVTRLHERVYLIARRGPPPVLARGQHSGRAPG